MTHIAKISVNNVWSKLENLIKEKKSDFVFEENKNYTIQNIGHTIYIKESSSVPIEDGGFIKTANENPLIYLKGQGDLYVKAESCNSILNIGDNE